MESSSKSSEELLSVGCTKSCSCILIGQFSCDVTGYKTKVAQVGRDRID